MPVAKRMAQAKVNRMLSQKTERGLARPREIVTSSAMALMVVRMPNSRTANLYLVNSVNQKAETIRTPTDNLPGLQRLCSSRTLHH